MILFLLLPLILAQATADFADPEVSGDGATATTMEVDVSVALRGSDGPVVAHMILPGQSPEVRPLVEQAGGRWGSTLELRRADWRVVFEDVATGTLSYEASLTELGLDPALLGITPPGTSAPAAAEGANPAWLVLAVVGLAMWVAVVWRGRRRVRPRHLRR